MLERKYRIAVVYILARITLRTGNTRFEEIENAISDENLITRCGGNYLLSYK